MAYGSNIVVRIVWEKFYSRTNQTTRQRYALKYMNRLYICQVYYKYTIHLPLVYSKVNINLLSYYLVLLELPWGELEDNETITLHGNDEEPFRCYPVDATRTRPVPPISCGMTPVPGR